MKYNSIGEQLITKAQELDPNYKPDKFNDMSEAIDVILNNTGGDIWLDITPYLSEDETSISQEGFDLVWNAFSSDAVNPSNKYAGIINAGYKMFFNGDIFSDKIGLNFIANMEANGVRGSSRATIYNDKSAEFKIENSTNIPALPSDASTKTYTLKAVNGVLTWVEG